MVLSTHSIQSASLGSLNNENGNWRCQHIQYPADGRAPIEPTITINNNSIAPIHAIITTLRDDEQATTTDKNCLKSGKGLRSRFKSKLFCRDFACKYCSYPKIYLLCNISICSNCILILPIGSWDSNCQCIT